MKTLGKIGNYYIHLEMFDWLGQVWICNQARCDRSLYPTLHARNIPEGKWKWNFYITPHFWQDDVVKAVSKATQKALRLRLNALKHVSDKEMVIEVAQEVVEQLLGSAM